MSHKNRSDTSYSSSAIPCSFYVESWFEMGPCQILLLRDCLTHIKIDVSMPNMSHLLQGPEHPNPGMPYTARGFPRYCYLPDNEKGRKVRYHTLMT